MKQIILTLAMLFALSATVSAGGQKHRHHAVATAVKTTPASAVKNAQTDTLKDAVAASQTAASGGIDAYSDTTGVDKDEAEEYSPSYQNNRNDTDDDEINEIFGRSFAKGVGGIILAIFIITLVFLFLLAPIIVVILVLRFFIKRHNDRVALAEKAMASGQPIPDEVREKDKKDPDHQWEIGVRNVSIGGGLMVLFWFLGADSIIGVGALILCMGLGQMYIARHSVNRKSKNDNSDSTDLDINRQEY